VSGTLGKLADEFGNKAKLHSELKRLAVICGTVNRQKDE
jgi:hypothetical protein